MWTEIINNTPYKREEKTNIIKTIEESLTRLDNEQDIKDVLNFVTKKINDRKNFCRTIQLVNTMKKCAKELTEISPDFAFFVFAENCLEGTNEVEVGFQELYEALDDMTIY